MRKKKKKEKHEGKNHFTGEVDSHVNQQDNKKPKTMILIPEEVVAAANYRGVHDDANSEGEEKSMEFNCHQVKL